MNPGARNRAGVVVFRGRRLARLLPFSPFPPSGNALAENTGKDDEQKDQVEVFRHEANSIIATSWIIDPTARSLHAREKRKARQVFCVFIASFLQSNIAWLDRF